MRTFWVVEPDRRRSTARRPRRPRGGAHRAGQLRTDFTSADIPLLLEHLTTRIPVTAERATTLHQRYLDLALTGLRTPTATTPPCPARPGSALGGAQRVVERV
ncbi:hypothetical protein [Streptomyces sp. NPDC020951]|uniref:hypothetical protein n=1 Tax=Streptomyces sp. NPDC020951 TaxID=3365104 RepID=UPI0037A8D776